MDDSYSMQLNMRKAALHNLGCKVNAYETEAMQQILENAGYEIVPFTEYADVYVVNTCSVTNMAQKKSRQMLRRAKKWNPEAIIIAAGCYVNAEHDTLKNEKFVDIVVGNNCKKDIVEVIQEYLKNSARGDNYIEIGKTQEYEEMGRLNAAHLDHQRAYVKIQDGCNQFCSYCIIPYTRGRVRSRDPERILDEIQELAQTGVKEFVLTGIHISSYGVDFTEQDMDLGDLIERIGEIPEVERIRIGSLEPRIVTAEFIQKVSKSGKLCPHFHLSLQSACNETLKRMNRKYTTEEYENACNILRKNFTHPAITTDVIVGFPGETEEEFAQTKEYLKRIHFYEMHIFKYSRRQGTRAAVMEHQVPEEIKTKRSAQLLALAESMSREFRAYYVGKEEEVLFEEPMEVDGETWYTGYTKEYVKIAAKTAEPLDNVMKRGRVEAALTDEIYRMKL